jgi:hypothetical protein
MAAIEVHRVARPQAHERAIAAPSHRLLVRPIGTGGHAGGAIDITDGVIRAVAHDLWQHNHGNETLNWLEAERLVQHLLDLAWESQRLIGPVLAAQEIEVSPDRRRVAQEPFQLDPIVDAPKVGLAA